MPALNYFPIFQQVGSLWIGTSYKSPSIPALQLPNKAMLLNIFCEKFNSFP